MDKITKKSGVLHIPDHLLIPYIVGEDSQRQVLRSVHRIVDSAVAVAYGKEKSIEWKEIVCKDPVLPEKDVALFNDSVIGFRNPLCNPENGKVIFPAENLIDRLDLHTCFQPVHCIKGFKSSFGNSCDLNLFLFTGGSESAHDLIEFEYAKVIKSALRFAVKNGLPGITIVHSENLKVSMEWAFKVWGYEIADKEFSDYTFSMSIYHSLSKLWGVNIAEEELVKAKACGKVIINDESIDTFLKRVSDNPKDYSVVVALKSCGDFLSDELTRLIGAIGILPRAFYNYENGHALFESVYSSNLERSRGGLVSFVPDLLATLMLLNYIGWNKAEELVTDAFLKDCFCKAPIRAEMDVTRQISGSVVRNMVSFKKEVSG